MSSSHSRAKFLFHRFFLLLFSCCMVACADWTHARSDSDAASADYDDATNIAASAGDVQARSSVPLSVLALRAIRARSTERTILRDGNYESGSSGGRLLYERSETGRGGRELRNARRAGSPLIFTRVTAAGETDGQCVAFVKTASGRTGLTSDWVRGVQATRNCSQIVQGTAVGTFAPDGTFAGHVGFMKSCSATSLTLWDQNFWDPPDGVVRQHTLRGTNGGVSDPRQYYVVLAP